MEGGPLREASRVGSAWLASALVTPADHTVHAQLGHGRVSDPRWSPSGARLAWVDALRRPGDVVVAPADGSGPAGRRHRRVRRRAAATAGRPTTSSSSAAADGRLVVVRAEGGVVRVLTRDGDAFAPAVSVRGEVACAIERDDACDVATVPLDGSQWPRARLARRLRVGPGVVARRPRARVARVGPARHAVGRVAHRRARRRRQDARRRRRARVRPAALLARRRAPRVHPRRRSSWVDDAPLLDEQRTSTRSRRGVAGQRSYAWSPDGAELAWCRNEYGFGRLVIGAPGRKSARELSKGWHRGLDWGDGGIVCVRSGAVTPPQVVVLAAERLGAPRDRARSGRRVRTHRRSSSRGRSRGSRGTRPCTACCGGRADATGAAPIVVQRARRPDRPGARRLEPARAVLRAAGLRRCCSRTTAARPATASRTGSALEGRWGERDVADVAAGIRHAVKEGWCDAGAGRADGRERGRAHRAERRRAASRPRRARSIALFPVTDLLDLDATTHRFESGYNSRARRRAARRARRRTSRTRRSRTRPQIRAPVLLLHGTRRQGRAARRSRPRSTTRCGAAGTPVERHVYEGEGHGWRQAATVADELERDRRVPRRRCVAMSRRRRVPRPEARRRPRGAARARRGRRHERGRAHDRRRRAGRRQDPVAALQLPVQGRGPARPRPAAGARSRGARRGRPSWRSAPRCRPSGSCSAGVDGRADLLDGRAPTTGALGLVLLGYPLHPPGKPEQLRVEHFPQLTMPVLFVERHARRVRHARRAEAAREEDQGSGHVPLDRDRRPRLQAAEVERPDASTTALAGVAEAVVAFVTSLPRRA